MSSKYLSRPGFTIFIFCFLFLFTFRPQAVFYPPYWDNLGGTFLQAVWLADNQFNYFQLAFEEAGYLYGGPRVYFLSVYPLVQALGMLLIPHQKLFLFVNHVLGFFMAGVTVVVFFKILLRRFDSKTAIFGSTLLFFHPLFLSMSYNLNMEMPTLLFGLLGVYFYLKEDHLKAGILFLICFFIKASGLLFSLAVVPCFLMCDLKESKNRKYIALYLLPLFIHALHLFLESKFFYKAYEHVELNQGFDIAVLYRKLLLFDMWFFCTIGLLVGIVVLVLSVIKQKKPLSHLLSEYKLLCVAWIFCLLILGCSLIMRSFLPRYLLIAFPFIFILLVWILTSLHRNLLFAAMLIMLCFYSLNMYGGIYDFVIKDFYHGRSNNGHMLERTLAYERDMEANLNLVKLMNEKYKNYTIVASYPYLHMFVSPRFGFVKEPRKVIAPARKCFRWLGVKTIDEIDMKDPMVRSRLVWIWNDNLFQMKNRPDPSKDLLLDVVQQGLTKIIVFQKALP